MVLSLWPALAAQRRAWPTLGIAVAVLVAVMTMVSTAAKVGMLVSLLSACISWRAPRLVAAAFGGGLVLLAIMLPLAAPDSRSVIAIHEEAPWIKSSGIHRLLIWRFTADRIADRPIQGWGMDASRELPGGHLNLGRALPAAGLGLNAEALPLHPHDAILQWQVELRVPGTVLSLAIVIWALWKLAWQASLPRWYLAGALAWAAAALVVAMLSYGVWQEWWLSSLWLTCASYAAVDRERLLPARQMLPDSGQLGT
jgi:O-antigen ligase